MQIHLFHNNDIIEGILCFNNCEILSNEVSDHTKRRKAITNEYLYNPFYLKGSEIREYFASPLDDIYLPKHLFALLYKMVLGSQVINKKNISPDYVVLCNTKRYQISVIEDFDYLEGINSTNDYLLLVEETIRFTEKWLYQQGITNLNYYYYHPNLIYSIWKRFLN